MKCHDENVFSVSDDMINELEMQIMLQERNLRNASLQMNQVT